MKTASGTAPAARLRLLVGAEDAEDDSEGQRRRHVLARPESL